MLYDTNMSFNFNSLKLLKAPNKNRKTINRINDLMAYDRFLALYLKELNINIAVIDVMTINKTNPETKKELE